MTERPSQQEGETVEGTDYDAVVVGAGMSGMYTLHRLRDHLGLSVKVIERADDVGGVWYWNRYPGARCDVESHVYCFSFSDEILDEWEWSRKYPEQPEILEYQRFVADHLDLRQDIEFGSEVNSAIFDDDRGTWEVTTDDGSSVTSKYFITAVGCITEPYVPDWDGIDSYEGEWYHPARWPHEPVDFTDKRVAVIGTGSSGVQVIPKIAKRDIEHLSVFQRTPTYCIPARDKELTDEEWKKIQENYDDIWETSHNTDFGLPYDYWAETGEGMSMQEMEEFLEPLWEKGGLHLQLSFENLLANEETNEKVCTFLSGKIREAVDDPRTAEKLVPDGHYFGTKRIPMHTDYYDTFNRNHVSFVDVNESPIERITPNGIQTADTEHEFDIIVSATGYDTFTGALTAMNIQGRNGLELDEKWDGSPETYLGLGVHGFPNMFTVTGPLSPSVLVNMPVTIEHHVEWISETIDYLVENDIQYIEPTRMAEKAWAAHTQEMANQTLFGAQDAAQSYYRNSNIPDQEEFFIPYPGGETTYHDTINEVAENGFEGFKLTDTLQNLGHIGDQPQLSVLEGD